LAFYFHILLEGLDLRGEEQGTLMQKDEMYIKMVVTL